MSTVANPRGSLLNHAAAAPTVIAQATAGSVSIDSLMLGLERGADHEETVNVLLNLAAAGAQREAASEALLRLCRDPNKSHKLREQIFEGAFELYRAFDGVRSKHSANQLVEPLTTPLLYLAGQRARELKSQWTDPIGRALRERVGSLGEGSVEKGGPGNFLVQKGRRATEEELGEISKACSGLHVSPATLNLDPRLEPSSVTQQLLAVIDGAAGKSTFAAVVHYEGHWVPLLISRDGQRFNFLAFDPDRRPQRPDTLEPRLNNALRESLGDHVGQVTVVHANLQEKQPSACGPYASMVLQEVDRRLSADPQLGVQALQTLLEELRGRWLAQEPRELEALITSERAHLLSLVAAKGAEIGLRADSLAVQKDALELRNARMAADIMSKQDGIVHHLDGKHSAPHGAPVSVGGNKRSAATAEQTALNQNTVPAGPRVADQAKADAARTAAATTIASPKNMVNQAVQLPMSEDVRRATAVIDNFKGGVDFHTAIGVKMRKDVADLLSKPDLLNSELIDNLAKIQATQEVCRANNPYNPATIYDSQASNWIAAAVALKTYSKSMPDNSENKDKLAALNTAIQKCERDAERLSRLRDVTHPHTPEVDRDESLKILEESKQKALEAMSDALHIAGLRDVSAVEKMFDRSMSDYLNTKERKPISNKFSIPSRGALVEVTCSQVEASKLSGLEAAYKKDGLQRVNSHAASEHRHAVNLNVSRLKIIGKRDFAFVRHGVLSAFHLTPRGVSRLSSEELGKVALDLNLGITAILRGKKPTQAQLKFIGDQVRNSPVVLGQLRAEANLNRARESVQAAVHALPDTEIQVIRQFKELQRDLLEFSEPLDQAHIGVLKAQLVKEVELVAHFSKSTREKFEEWMRDPSHVNLREAAKSLKNDSPTIRLTSVSTVTPDWPRSLNSPFFKDENERLMWKDQAAAWSELQDKPLEITLPDGTKANVKPDIARFNFPVNGAANSTFSSFNWLSGVGSTSKPINDEGMKKLFGDGFHAVAKNNTWEPSADSWIGAAISKATDEDKETLTNLARQIATVYARGDYVGKGKDPHVMVKRLLTLANLSGNGVALLNCKSGKDRTAVVETSARQFFLQIAVNKAIPVPHHEPDQLEAQQMLTLHMGGGSAEIQQAHTNYTGTKQNDDNFFRFFGIVGQSMQALLMGASSLTHS